MQHKIILITCLVLCTVISAAVAIAPVPKINNVQAQPLQIKSSDITQLYKYYSKSVKRISGSKLTWRKKMKLFVVYAFNRSKKSGAEKTVLLKITLVFLMLLSVALLLLIIYGIIQLILMFAGGVAGIATPSG